MGLRCHGESHVPWTNDGDAFGRRILPWKRPSIDSLPLARRALSRCNALTFLSGDDGDDGVVSLLGGVALEARDCQSVMAATVVARKVEA